MFSYWRNTHSIRVHTNENYDRSMCVRLDDSPFARHLRTDEAYKKYWPLIFGCWDDVISDYRHEKPKFETYMRDWYLRFHTKIQTSGFTSVTSIHTEPLRVLINELLAGYGDHVFEWRIPVGERDHVDVMALRRYARFIKIITPCYVMIYERMKDQKHTVEEIDQWFDRVICSLAPVNEARLYINDIRKTIYNSEVDTLIQKFPLLNGSANQQMLHYTMSHLPRALMIVDSFNPGMMDVGIYFRACITKRVWTYCAETHKLRLEKSKADVSPDSVARSITNDLEQLQINKTNLTVDERRRQASLLIVNFLQSIGYASLATSFWNVAYKTNKKN